MALLNMNGFDEYMGDIFELNDVIQFNSSPVAKVEAPQENSLTQNEMGLDETFLNLKGGQCNIVLKKEVRIENIHL